MEGKENGQEKGRDIDRKIEGRETVKREEARKERIPRGGEEWKGRMRRRENEG